VIKQPYILSESNIAGNISPLIELRNRLTIVVIVHPLAGSISAI
jgi:hypothetical protein